ncbi:MAG TPA: hypothetical protein PKZ60_00015 [Candidatus Saccharicenans sp.]|nr:hypothetical protein [Candidatus Saccharicenans sp.]
MSDILTESKLLDYLSSKESSDGIIRDCLDLINKGESTWKCLYLAARNLEKNNFEGEYDWPIIEALEKSQTKGLNKDADLDAYLESLKILAGLYLKYSDYKKANNCLILFEGLSKQCPEWVKKLKATIHIEYNLEQYLSGPELYFKNILELDGHRALFDYEVPVIKSLIYKGIDQLEKADNQDVFKKLNFYLGCYDYLKEYEDNLGEELEFLKQMIFHAISEVRRNDLSEEIFLLLKLMLILSASLENVSSKLNLQIQAINDNISQKVVEEIRQGLPETGDLKNKTNRSNIKILILGDLDIHEKDIYGIAKEYDIPNKNIDIIKDWDKIKSYDIEKLRYNSRYDGIMIGPVPHSVKGRGDYSSVIETLNESGFPVHVDVREPNGELKITKSTFRQKMKLLIELIEAHKLY